MNRALTTVRNLLRSEDGPTATEYAIMLALIIVVSIAAISGLGTTVDAIFTNLDGSLPTGAAS